jgi:hypothetical protein
MWKYLAGAASALLLVVAGLMLGRVLADEPKPAPQAEADPLAAPMAFGDLPEPPRASERTKEQKRFDRYDKDKNGAVSRPEYLANRQKAFARLDTNGDGRLSFEEYAVKTADKFQRADRNRNGMLDRPEFSTTRVIRKERPRCDCAPAKAGSPPESPREGDGEEG